MSHALILQHAPYAGPGRIVPIFRDFGMPVEVRKLHNGDTVPPDLEECRVLIVLGGPMHVSDIGSDQYPYLAKEVELIKRVIASDRPFLGIALGAQLLAHAAGAKVYPNAKPGPKPEDPPKLMPEFGWGPVTFPFPGGTEPIVMGMMDGAPMFHWHHDTFDLPRLPPPPNLAPGSPPPPAGNALLSSSKICKNQAFRFKNRLFGFQYHFEFTQEEFEALLAQDKDEAVKVLGEGAEQKIRDDTQKYYSRYARLGEHIVRNFVQFLKVY